MSILSQVMLFYAAGLWGIELDPCKHGMIANMSQDSDSLEYDLEEKISDGFTRAILQYFLLSQVIYPLIVRRWLAIKNDFLYCFVV